MRTLKIYLTNKQYQKIRAIAYKKTITLSQVIRWCIDLYPGPEKPTEELFMKELEAVVKNNKKSKNQDSSNEPPSTSGTTTEWLF